MAAHTPEDSAKYILTIFKRLRCMTGGSVLAGNLTLPFQQDGWQLSDLEEGQKFGIEKGWMEMGKENKFMKLTEAGYGLYDSVAD
ncbi:MAG: hypothetical protein ACLP8A_15000 [Methylovirgula sp.]